MRTTSMGLQADDAHVLRDRQVDAARREGQRFVAAELLLAHPDEAVVVLGLGVRDARRGRSAYDMSMCWCGPLRRRPPR